MSRKRRRRASRKVVQTKIGAVGGVQHPHMANAAVEAPERLEELKPGPGQVFKEELIDATSGHAKRIRNVGHTPLSMAFYGHKLTGPSDVTSGITADDRYSAGERFAAIWYRRESTGSNPFERIGGGDHYWWNDSKADASEIVSRLRTRMYDKNFEIVRRFCGEGYSMTASVRDAGIDMVAQGVIPRVREALDDLVTAMTGRKAA